MRLSQNKRKPSCSPPRWPWYLSSWDDAFLFSSSSSPPLRLPPWSYDSCQGKPCSFTLLLSFCSPPLLTLCPSCKTPPNALTPLRSRLYHTFLTDFEGHSPSGSEASHLRSLYTERTQKVSLKDASCYLHSIASWKGWVRPLN